jgi:hypothetical protein
MRTETDTTELDEEETNGDWTCEEIINKATREKVGK